jgi:hypothetical protein
MKTNVMMTKKKKTLHFIQIKTVSNQTMTYITI